MIIQAISDSNRPGVYGFIIERSFDETTRSHPRELISELVRDVHPDQEMTILSQPIVPNHRNDVTIVPGNGGRGAIRIQIDTDNRQYYFRFSRSVIHPGENAVSTLGRTIEEIRAELSLRGHL